MNAPSTPLVVVRAPDHADDLAVPLARSAGEHDLRHAHAAGPATR